MTRDGSKKNTPTRHRVGKTDTGENWGSWRPLKNTEGKKKRRKKRLPVYLPYGKTWSFLVILRKRGAVGDAVIEETHTNSLLVLLHYSSLGAASSLLQPSHPSFG